MGSQRALRFLAAERRRDMVFMELSRINVKRHKQ
jgi:hypothetical protein